MRFDVLCFIFFACPLLVLAGVLNEEFTWTRITYVWPRQSRFGYGYYKPEVDSGALVFPDSDMTNGEETGDVPSNVNYIFENNIPLGANLYKNKLFVTVPRRRNGIPSSLNYVNINNPDRHNVPLIPYPNWDVNRLDYAGSERIISVYRVAADPCDRLWMVDTGVIEIPGNNTRVQPAAVVIINLNTDTIIRRYEIPANLLVRPNSYPANLVVDTTASTCDDAYAYIPDLASYGLLVYSYRENRAWRVAHNYFSLEPLRGDFSVGGIRFQWTDGIFSVGLSNILPDGERNLYFHAMAGTNMYSVSTRVLKNRELATRSYHGTDFKYLGDRGEGYQTAGSALHQSSGVFFMGLVNQNGLACWNTRKPLRKEFLTIIQKDDDKMIYPCDVKVSADKLVLLTNSMPIFIYSNLDYSKINFRIWLGNVQDIVRGTPCAA